MEWHGIPPGTVVVVGTSLAGWRTAQELRSHGFTGDIVLVGEEAHLPYERPPLSKQVLTGAWEPERAMLADAATIAELGIDLRLGVRGVGLDVAARTVALSTGERLGYDAVVIATGATARPLPGVETGPAVRVLRTLEDAVGLRDRIQGGGHRLVVVGAGFIGTEVASSALAHGAEVHLVDPVAAPLSRVLDPAEGAAARRLLAAAGVGMHLGRSVVAVAPFGGAGGRGVRVELDGGVTLVADTVVVGIGAVPATGWLAGSGLAIDDGVVCDERCMAVPGVFAAGDVARWFHTGYGRHVRVEHWTNAAEQAAAVATAIVEGSGAAPFAPVPYVWSDQVGVKIQVVGLPGAGDDVEVVLDDPSASKLLSLHGRDGMLVAGVGIGQARRIAQVHGMLAAKAPFAEAVASFGA